MEFGLADKGVVVLASSGGIGRGVATEFAREGARVMLFSRSEEKLSETADAIAEETGNRPLFTVGSITNKDDVESTINRAASEFGNLWALFNNTGGPPAGTFEQFDDEAWQSAFEVTMLGYVRAIRAALPHMKKGGGGRIVSNTSVSTKQAIDGLLLSNVFRSGLVGLGKSLAREVGPDGILVNTVGPGRIDTDRIEQLDTIWAGQKGISIEQQRSESQASIPLQRYGTPSDFGRIVTFLSSKANAYLTGQNVLIDGAMVEAY
ncbi:MAG: SDR family oxidoreductase [Verrucomicrobiales bacterium]|jgi:3-oxoacyl-[acyl-carrier protein] reductase|nr:SDR family oxidoreductase [Verrucomicrobiales bacterium]MDA9923374.1 SDR family oxidoreductase [Verrucomicrobiales bacterium]MDB3941309.1 SDR family oxidoreductase [Verrucomicrobiales bacterium]